MLHHVQVTEDGGAELAALIEQASAKAQQLEREQREQERELFVC